MIYGKLNNTTPPTVQTRKMSDAASRVLGIPELLERILLNLDMRELLTSAQQVSQQFRHVIETSPNLQQKLFRRPSDQDELELFPVQSVPPFYYRGHTTGSRASTASLSAVHNGLSFSFAHLHHWVRSQASILNTLVAQPPHTSLKLRYWCRCGNAELRDDFDDVQILEKDGIRFRHVVESVDLGVVGYCIRCDERKERYFVQAFDIRQT